MGAEALIRWNHKVHGFLTPGRFLHYLEKTGDIVEIDFFILEQACILIKDRLDKGLFIVPISVNQSRANFKNPDYLERLQTLVEKYSIPPHALELEITETIFEKQNVSQDLILKMHELGFLVSIDDFGSGYSSLGLLNQISTDMIKIDKSLIDDCNTSKTMQTILSKVMEMASSIDLEIICEGVESQEQADLLLKMGCKYVQGYLFSKPINEENFLKWLDR